MKTYEVQTCDDISYEVIFSEVPVGNQFMVSYTGRESFICDRVSTYEVEVAPQHGQPRCFVSVNNDLKTWRSGS